MRIAAIGDSVIYGRKDPTGGWVGHLRRFLEDRDPGAAVFNLGIGGQTSADLLERMERELAPRTPDTVIIGSGLNDLYRTAPDNEPRIPVDQFERNVRRLIEIARGLDAATIVVPTLNPIERSPTPLNGVFYLASDTHAYNDAILRCADGPDVHVLPFHEAKGFSTASGTLADQIHPSTTGHTLLADIAMDLFSRL